MFHMNSTPQIFDSHICISNPVILTYFIYVNLDYTAYYNGVGHVAKSHWNINSTNSKIKAHS